MATIKDLKMVCSWYNLFGVNTPWAFFMSFGDLISLITNGGFDGAMLAQVRRTRSWSDLERDRVSPEALSKVISLTGSFRGEKGLGVLFSRRFPLSLMVAPFLPDVHDRGSVLRLQEMVGKGGLPATFNWMRPGLFNRERNQFAHETFQLTAGAFAQMGYGNVATIIQNLRGYGFDSVAIDLGIIQNPNFGGFSQFWDQIKNHVSAVHVPYDRDDLSQPWIDRPREREGLFGGRSTPAQVMLRHIRGSGWPQGSALLPNTNFQVVFEFRPGAVRRYRGQASLSSGLVVTGQEWCDFSQTLTGMVKDSLGTS